MINSQFILNWYKEQLKSTGGDYCAISRKVFTRSSGSLTVYAYYTVCLSRSIPEQNQLYYKIRNFEE